MSTTKAVRVACSGELKRFIKETEDYNIPVTHDIFEQGELSIMSQLLGVPLLLVKVRPSLVRYDRQPERKTYRYDIEGDYHPNPIAMILMSANQETQNLWSDRVGNVLIARVDKKPLHAAHLSTLLSFLNAAFQYSGQMSEEERKAIFTPAMFKTYYNGVAQMAASQGSRHELFGLPSPFEECDAEMREEGVVL